MASGTPKSIKKKKMRFLISDDVALLQACTQINAFGTLSQFKHGESGKVWDHVRMIWWSQLAEGDPRALEHGKTCPSSYDTICGRVERVLKQKLAAETERLEKELKGADKQEGLKPLTGDELMLDALATSLLQPYRDYLKAVEEHNKEKSETSEELKRKNADAVSIGADLRKKAALAALTSPSRNRRSRPSNTDADESEDDDIQVTAGEDLPSRSSGAAAAAAAAPTRISPASAKSRGSNVSRMDTMMESFIAYRREKDSGRAATNDTSLSPAVKKQLLERLKDANVDSKLIVSAMIMVTNPDWESICLLPNELLGDFLEQLRASKPSKQ